MLYITKYFFKQENGRARCSQACTSWYPGKSKEWVFFTYPWGLLQATSSTFFCLSAWMVGKLDCLLEILLVISKLFVGNIGDILLSIWCYIPFFILLNLHVSQDYLLFFHCMIQCVLIMVSSKNDKWSTLRPSSEKGKIR